jgi:predicted negative regulator of RcsB-dependent stress response
LVVGLPVVILVAVQAKNKPSPVVDTALKQAGQATTTGDYDGAYNKLKAQEGRATSTQQKTIYYMEIAAAAANDGKIPEAINYLKLRHQVDPGTVGADAQMMGALYEQVEDTADALAQYKLAIDYYRSLPPTSTTSALIQSLQTTVSQLENEQ